MKFSRNILSTFINISNICDDEICAVLNNIGLELESSKKITLPSNVVVGKVLEKSKHPDADKLNICKVDIGSEILQIVCGAKNVTKDQFVPVALIGAKIGKMEINTSTFRGIESRGMICSASELGLNKIEDGILVLDSSLGELTLGKQLCEYELLNDTIFEVAITPNRGDCLSVLGLARDLAVVFGLEVKCIKEIEDTSIVPGIGRIFSISFDDNLQSSLFYKVVKLEKLSNNFRLKLFLSLIDELGDDLLDNISKFATYMTGVVINTYKLDVKDESDKRQFYITSNNGIEQVCYPSTNEVISEIGVNYNKNIKANASNSFVVLESSYVPPEYVSKVIFQNKLKSDERISYLSTRGSSPMIESGIVYLCNLLRMMSNSIIYSSSQHLLQNYQPKRIDVNLDTISNIIGIQVRWSEIVDILKRMDFTINSTVDDKFIVVNPPLYRHDIVSIQDVAEEVLRIKGIDTIMSIPQNFSQYNNIDINYARYKFHRYIANRAISHRFFECIHYLFYKKEKLEFYGYEVIDSALELINPITSDLDTLRTSLIPSMLDSIVRNKNFGYSAIRLFEIGSIYNKHRVQSDSLAFAVYGYKETQRFPTPKGVEWNFYSFASIVSEIIGDFELRNRSTSLPKLYHPNIVAEIIKSGETIGVIGKLNPYIANELDLDDSCFICEISFDMLLKLQKNTTFKEFSRYQDSQRDITILIDKNITFGEVRDSILSLNMQNLVRITPLDIYSDDSFGGKISLSFRLVFQSKDSTLKDEDIKIDKILNLLNSKFGAVLR